MADQNQNQITGTLRTLKTDLELNKLNPQDRLQQAGNFVQARPETSNNLGALNTADVSLSNITSSPNIPLQESKTENQKKDIPTANPESNPKPNYTWSNMSSPSSPSPAFNPNNVKPTITTQNQQSQPVIEPKSGFSVLDDSIDLPLDNKDIAPTTIPNLNVNKSSTPNPNLEPSTLISNLDVNKPNEQLDINTLNLQNDVTDSKPKKSSLKNLISFTVVIVLLVLIGGGVYFYFNISNPVNTTVTTNTDTDNTDDTTPTSSFSSPLTASSILDISFVDSEPIRRTIATLLSDKSDTLIKLNLTKDNNAISLIDIADVLGITIPLIGTIENYEFYVYNQQGVYKLVSVLGLPSDQNAKSFIDNWSNSIPRDLAGFSINLPSRIVNDPQIKKSTVTNSAGNIFENYYYNYTSPTDSVDVSSYENFVLIASSQDSMKYVLEQIR
jgi:hypothetical protein